MEKKDIRFTEKQVDESWKEAQTQDPTPQEEAGAKDTQATPEAEPRVNFTSFATSLGFQCLVHLGLIGATEGQVPEVNEGAARDTIDILVLIKEKTKGNLNTKEEQLMNDLVGDLQLKFVEQFNPKP